MRHCIYGKVNIKERNFIIKILKFGKGYILQQLMTSGKSLTSAGTESPVHAFNLLLFHDVLTMAKVGVNPSSK